MNGKWKEGLDSPGASRDSESSTSERMVAANCGAHAPASEYRPHLWTCSQIKQYLLRPVAEPSSASLPTPVPVGLHRNTLIEENNLNFSESLEN